ncbi:MAG: SIS domain-containing protein, partial [Acidimicrobiales bacterium]
MFDATAGLPEQIEEAAAAAAQVDGLPAHDDIENVVVLGMGGSGIAGDVVPVVAGPFMAVPVVVHKGYGLPNFVDEHTLVFAVSFSGNTEETVEAVTEAALAGAKVVA